MVVPSQSASRRRLADLHRNSDGPSSSHEVMKTVAACQFGSFSVCRLARAQLPGGTRARFGRCSCQCGLAIIAPHRPDDHCRRNPGEKFIVSV